MKHLTKLTKQQMKQIKGGDPVILLEGVCGGSFTSGVTIVCYDENYEPLGALGYFASCDNGLSACLCQWSNAAYASC